MKKKIYVCSPLRGIADPRLPNKETQVEMNIGRAKDYSRQIALAGDLPFTPHIYFPTFLDDNIEEERTIGLDAGLSLFKQVKIDEIHVLGPRISSGMADEIELAEFLNIPVIRKEPDVIGNYYYKERTDVNA